MLALAPVRLIENSTIRKRLNAFKLPRFKALTLYLCIGNVFKVLTSGLNQLNNFDLQVEKSLEIIKEVLAEK